MSHDLCHFQFIHCPLKPGTFKLVLKWPGVLEKTLVSFTKDFLHEGYCEQKTGEHKLVAGDIKEETGMKQKEGKNSYELKFQKICLYVYGFILYTTFPKVFKIHEMPGGM